MLLPEKPMMGRYKDSRIGYFTTGFTEYGGPENRAVDKQFIHRFRLVKKDPKSDLSQPIKPITFYISREVPEKWHSAMKRAVEAWQSAFEKVGIRDGIVCRDAPTKAEDPDWDPEDARYSVIKTPEVAKPFLPTSLFGITLRRLLRIGTLLNAPPLISERKNFRFLTR